jgi:hypothetical protein
LSAVAALALVILLGYSSFILFYQMPERSRVGTGEPATLDENMALKATIDTLEAMWSGRQDRYFNVNQDPLHLGRVIKNFTYARAGATELEEESEIRLSATVIDENPKAIIKYSGKSYVVQVGDVIGKSYRVLQIEKMQVVLDNRGKRMVLVNKRAAGSEVPGEGSEYSNTIDYENYNY